MKKLVFVLMAAIVFTGCSVDDDGPELSYELAEIVANDLPEEFEFGESYEVTVTYILPTDCHDFVGLDPRRESDSGDKRRNIFVSAISVTEMNSECDTTIGGDQGTSKFSILIDEEGSYTFNFLVGEEGGEAVYETVVVPVVESTSSS